eukprot:SAG31_NODE_2826_length_5035_cov_2.062601_1_plen_46_part_00
MPWYGVVGPALDLAQTNILRMDTKQLYGAGVEGSVLLVRAAWCRP